MGKSTGPDLISNEVLKYSSIVTCNSITKLFNLILESGNYPTSWRKSYIILIYKAGDHLDLNNYRGISLQNCLAKLFSSALNKRLVRHYEDKFANQQFGFRANHRTTDSIFVLKTLISKYLNKRKQKIFACFVDLRRAFDSLWHNGLLYKLMINGIGLKFFEVVSDMYRHCESAVKIEHNITDYFSLARGVKQGDSLSPTLFNCFINDLHEIFDNSCDPLFLEESKVSSLSFADDLVLLSSSHEGLQNAINKLETYCFDWQHTVNIKKTKVLTFQNRYSPTPKVFYNKFPLSETKEYNFLGNIIDSKGNFKPAIQELSKKGLKVLFALRSRFANFQAIPVKLSIKLFDTLIRPVLLYNSEVWFMDNYFSIYKALKRSLQTNNNCDTLSLEEKFSFEKIHNKFCKSVLGLRKTACNISAKSELGRLPVTSYIKTQVLLYFSRLNSLNMNPLVVEASNINKKMHNEGIYTWYSFAKNIFEEFDLDNSDYELFDKPFNKIKQTLKKEFKTTIYDTYCKKIQTKLSSLTDSSKIYLYSKIKSEFKIENYLTDMPNFKTRQLLTKFRVSDHNLEIEVGRYKNTPRNERHCLICKQLEDEYHFFLYCNRNNLLRNQLFDKILTFHPNFMSEQPLDKLIYILDPKFELLPAVGNFIKQSLELRK